MPTSSRGPRPDAQDTRKPDNEATYDTESAPELPEDLTVQETLDWVSGDKKRAKVALEAEEGREKPRSGVTGELSRLVDDETGAGVASGEA